MRLVICTWAPRHVPEITYYVPHDIAKCHHTRYTHLLLFVLAFILIRITVMEVDFFG